MFVVIFIFTIENASHLVLGFCNFSPCCRTITKISNGQSGRLQNYLMIVTAMGRDRGRILIRYRQRVDGIGMRLFGGGFDIVAGRECSCVSGPPTWCPNLGSLI